MTYHILNGDCLAGQLEQTNLEGVIITCRECLVEGPSQSGSLDDFYLDRAAYIQKTYDDGAENYFQKIVSEFSRIQSIPTTSEICLWFEHDLFCQVNMWFVMTLLSTDIKVCRVSPVIKDSQDTWKGFGISDTAMLEQAYTERVLMSGDDMKLGRDLWKAYSAMDFESLQELSHQQSNSFKFLPEVCQAHIDRFTDGDRLNRPERVIMELINQTSGEFIEVYSAFSVREGIYGFGDLQVRTMYDRLI
jgi:hypothetical protein